LDGLVVDEQIVESGELFLDLLNCSLARWGLFLAHDLRSKVNHLVLTTDGPDVSVIRPDDRHSRSDIMLHKTQPEDSHRGRLIRRHAAMLERLAGGEYDCEIEPSGHSRPSPFKMHQGRVIDC